MTASRSPTAGRLRARAAAGSVLARAPGRVNLVGEHTDYNDGFVLPAAIDRSTWVAARRRDDAKLVMRSDDLGETVTVDLAAPGDGARGAWSDYPHGLARALVASGIPVPGADLRIASDLPLGAGLSSSAALLVATGRALLALAGATVDPVELALLCREAENGFVGARSGIMDPVASLLCERGSALLLDCRSLGHRPVELPGDLRIVVCNSLVRHELATGEYNRRRAECEAGVASLARARPGIVALRDATLADLGAIRDVIDPVLFRRCRHVVTENRRVLDLATALDAGHLSAVGTLMGESHASLRDDFEVSCAELDLLVEIASGVPGVIGARMTGGGFGGCTVQLVRSEAVDAFRHRVATVYRRETGRLPEILVCEASAGAAGDARPA
ncbi:galactokinase [bacterium]|nr:galactokinase [bacterium]